MLTGRHCRPVKGLVATTDGADRAVANRLSTYAVAAVAEHAARSWASRGHGVAHACCRCRDGTAVDLIARYRAGWDTRAPCRHGQGVGGSVTKGDGRSRIVADRG